VALSTAAVFKALDAPELGKKQAGPVLPVLNDFDALVAWLAAQGNDLEAPARSLAPAVGEVIDALKVTADCRLARMSGSGATCFGIFADEAEARAAEAALKTAHPQWWIAAARRL
jgi:4-diphosphocytidyl-2-C-methyl-D-erythritol kinase